MRQRELRHDVELLVDVEQLVAECGEYDASDIGAASVGSSMSGSSARPMRSVVWAWTLAASDSSKRCRDAAKRRIFMALVSNLSPSLAAVSGVAPDYIKPRNGLYFLARG